MAAAGAIATPTASDARIQPRRPIRVVRALPKIRILTLLMCEIPIFDVIRKAEPELLPRRAYHTAKKRRSGTSTKIQLRGRTVNIRRSAQGPRRNGLHPHPVSADSRNSCDPRDPCGARAASE